jgi:hypothetical protein
MQRVVARAAEAAVQITTAASVPERRGMGHAARGRGVWRVCRWRRWRRCMLCRWRRCMLCRSSTPATLLCVQSRPHPTARRKARPGYPADRARDTAGHDALFPAPAVCAVCGTRRSGKRKKKVQSAVCMWCAEKAKGCKISVDGTMHSKRYGSPWTLASRCKFSRASHISAFSTQRFARAAADTRCTARTVPRPCCPSSIQALSAPAVVAVLIISHTYVGSTSPPRPYLCRHRAAG